MQNFYIIHRSGAITEVPYSEQNYKTTYEQWVNGGRLIVKPRGHENPIGINAVDITNIYDEDTYDSFVRQTQQKLFIKNGVWFDGKHRQEVFAEKYIEHQRKEQKALEPSRTQEEPLSVEQQQRIAEIKRNIKNMVTR